MKLGPIPNLDREKKISVKKVDYDMMSANFDVIVIFSNFWPIWSYSEARF